MQSNGELPRMFTERMGGLNFCVARVKSCEPLTKGCASYLDVLTVELCLLFIIVKDNTVPSVYLIYEGVETRRNP